MPPPAPHYEDDVLKGTALVLLECPPRYLTSIPRLRSLLDACYPNNGVRHVFMNRPPVRSTSDSKLQEYGAIFFHSAEAAWEILDRVEVTMRTEDGALELRRGYLPLNNERILVEGVLTWGPNGRPRPAPATAAAAAPTPAAPIVVYTPPSSQQPPAQAAARASPPAAPPSPVPTPAPVSSAKPAGEGETVVLSMHMKEVYNRHRNMRDEGRRPDRNDVPSMFPLTPFMVYQMLRGECEPRKIVLIDARRSSGSRLMKVLVEVANAAVAEHLIDVFTRRAVEFVSESANVRPPERSRKPAHLIVARPICAEVRYFVNCYYSARTAQSQFHPNGERNYHRTISARNTERMEMNLVDPADAALVSVLAPRKWQIDLHQKLPASRGGEEPMAVDATAQLPPAHRDRRRSPQRGGRRSRSPSYSDSRSPSRSSSSGSSRGHHYRPRPRHEEPPRHARPAPSSQGSAGGSSGVDRPSPRFLQPPVAAVETSPRLVSVPAAAVSAAAPAQESVAPVVQRERVDDHQPQQQQQQQRSAGYSAAPPPPPPPRTESDGLPPNWRPIFSVEYQQTYYAYRDPQTGTEMTTWERPGT